MFWGRGLLCPAALLWPHVMRTMCWWYRLQTPSEVTWLRPWEPSGGPATGPGGQVEKQSAASQTPTHDELVRDGKGGRPPTTQVRVLEPVQAQMRKPNEAWMEMRVSNKNNVKDACWWIQASNRDAQKRECAKVKKRISSFYLFWWDAAEHAYYFLQIVKVIEFHRNFEGGNRPL